MRKSLACFKLLLFALVYSNLTEAQVRYTITPLPADSLLQVEMQFRASTTTTSLQMPSWSPGIYVLNNAWSAVKKLSATDGFGHALTFNHPTGDTWTVNTKINQLITVRYQVPAEVTTEPLTLHYGAPAVYLYKVGRKNESCLLEFNVPTGWKIAVGLTTQPGRHQRPVFFAKNYDELLDNPITMGDYIERHYNIFGKDHTIAFRGPGSRWVDYRQTVAMTQFVSKMIADFFGGLPYQKYVWHFNVYEGSSLAGGTEHASSTDMHLTTEEGPDVLQGMAHEYFHLWNVKRIHPKPLGPFDYRQLPKTGALWWSEGVTDYYSMLLPYRYGAWDRALFLKHALNEIGQVRDNPDRLQVSPYDASYKISPASGIYYKVNYYPTGWVLGMLFDIELRAASGGKHSLDDVMLALWKQCSNGQPDFAENDIRRLLIQYGGPHMGTLYKQWVLHPGELPIDQELAKAGLLIGPSGIVAIEGANTDQRRLQADWLRSAVIAGLTPPSAVDIPSAVKGDTSLLRAFSGRYELAEDVLFEVTHHPNGLSAGLSGDDSTPLIRQSDSTFFYSSRNALLSFSRNSTGRLVTGINWNENGRTKYIQRIGPLINDLQRKPDPRPALTFQLRSVLNALGDGIRADNHVPGLAPLMEKEYITNGPVHGLAGVRTLDYIYSETVQGPLFKRHGAEVSQLLYYKLVTERKNTYLIVYLTRNNDLTDWDYVDH